VRRVAREISGGEAEIEVTPLLDAVNAIYEELEQVDYDAQMRIVGVMRSYQIVQLAPDSQELRALVMTLGRFLALPLDIRQNARHAVGALTGTEGAA